MKKETEKIIETLKKKGLRVTHQRFAVYQNLLQRYDHPTAEQILIALNKNAPTSSQATVYSSLQALCEVGLVREVLLDQGICRYDANVDPHHHFRCQSCGTISDISWEKFNNIDLNQLPSTLQVHSYELTFRGLCDQCSN